MTSYGTGSYKLELVFHIAVVKLIISYMFSFDIHAFCDLLFAVRAFLDKNKTKARIS